MTKMEKIIISCDTKEELELYRHTGPFDEGIAALGKEGLDVITVRDLAQCISWDNLNHMYDPDGFSDFCTCVAENFNYSIQDQAYFVASRDYNPMLKNPKEVTDCGRNYEPPYVGEKASRELRERAELDPEKAIKSGVLYLPRKVMLDKSAEKIPSMRLLDHPLTHFLFRDMAHSYGSFLCGKNKDIFYLDDICNTHFEDVGFSSYTIEMGVNAIFGYDYNMTNVAHDDFVISGFRRVPVQYKMHSPGQLKSQYQDKNAATARALGFNPDCWGLTICKDKNGTFYTFGGHPGYERFNEFRRMNLEILVSYEGISLDFGNELMAKADDLNAGKITVSDLDKMLLTETEIKKQ